VRVSEELRHLYDHLEALQNTFHTPYVKYRTAFTKLLLEMERRRRYKKSAEDIVRGMIKQLNSMTEGIDLSYFEPVISLNLPLQRRTMLDIDSMWSMAIVCPWIFASTFQILLQDGKLCPAMDLHRKLYLL